MDGSGVNNATKRTDGFGHDDSRNWTFVDRFAFASQDGNWNIKMKKWTFKWKSLESSKTPSVDKLKNQFESKEETIQS